MVNDAALLVHVNPKLVKVETTVMKAVIGTLVLLMATNAGILPVPLAGRPMEGFELVQLKTEPGGIPEKETALVVAPLQTTIFETENI